MDRIKNTDGNYRTNGATLGRADDQRVAISLNSGIYKARCYALIDDSDEEVKDTFYKQLQSEE
ncbi:hypothetical protein CHS0354_026634 [Potamilus streckersoni]|uniref:Uncharacterized protein n=1 Tax=Potamilus streckersoni TaxID=2493646 RepID=A0AAE0W380_9BIVA|nr:hypothetical protein CHS0354_026634 [Potamilus streckersoni]